MTYRNHVEAENFRLKQELEERESRIKELENQLEDSDESIDKLEEKLLKKSWFREMLDKREQRKHEKQAERARNAYWKRRAKAFRRTPYRRQELGSKLFIGAVFVFTAFMLVSTVVHYFTDINQGTVVGRDHKDSYYDSDGDYHPESWSLTITDSGETATWHVSEWEYNHFQDGEEYCYKDFFHECE